jgi:hypothetical protein
MYTGKNDPPPRELQLHQIERTIDSTLKNAGCGRRSSQGSVLIHPLDSYCPDVQHDLDEDDYAID